MPHHLIFEGAELSGKSWLMSQVYDRLEVRYNRGGPTLDGCHWFNCDVGVFGTRHGRALIENYLAIFRELEERNLIVEKLHLSDRVYNLMHGGRTVEYGDIEDALLALDFKIILLTFPRDEELIRARLADRLRLYPHYERILQTPAWYLRQQENYLKEAQGSKLPFLIVESRTLPDSGPVDEVLTWIGEGGDRAASA